MSDGSDGPAGFTGSSSVAPGRPWRAVHFPRPAVPHPHVRVAVDQRRAEPSAHPYGDQVEPRGTRHRAATSPNPASRQLGAASHREKGPGPEAASGRPFRQRRPGLASHRLLLHLAIMPTRFAALAQDQRRSSEGELVGHRGHLLAGERPSKALSTSRSALRLWTSLDRSAPR